MTASWTPIEAHLAQGLAYAYKVPDDYRGSVGGASEQAAVLAEGHLANLARAAAECRQTVER